MSAQPNQQRIEDEVLKRLAKYSRDPLRYALWSWPNADLRAWQVDYLTEFGERFRNEPFMPLKSCVSSGHGPGKALAHGEPVLTPQGWVPIEAVHVGDHVIAADGTSTAVIGVYPQGERDLFRVTLDDGCSVVVDGEHQWLTLTRNNRKGGQRDKLPTVKTTKEIAATITVANGHIQTLNHQLPVLLAVQHPRALLPIEPYLFGSWLGDGDAVGRITGMDDCFQQLAAAGACMGTPVVKRGNLAHSRSMSGISRGLRTLELFGCRSHEKRIPACYLYASVEQRIALLQGLLDTDGTVGKGNAIGFDVTAPQLADGMAELVRSLGGVVRRADKIGSYSGKLCRKVYRLAISLPRGIIPFRLPRKIARYSPQWGSKNCERTRKRHIATVKACGRGLATCIAVEHPSKLFVTRDHIVTHNSAVMGMLANWAIETRPTKGVVTADTDTQLRTKTWPEVIKWHDAGTVTQVLKGGPKFEVSATQLWHVDYKAAWCITAVPWSEHNPDAFAGLHNQGNRVFVGFDEASGIHDRIWEVTEGALTDEKTEILWPAFGNPTRNTGRFYESCFGSKRHRCITRVIDTRTVEGTNKAQIDKWAEDYGEDSDFFRVRVRGLPPSASEMQFIERSIVEASQARAPIVGLRDPLIMAVDIARGGNDNLVIAYRRGLDAKSIPWIVIPGSETRDANKTIGKIVDLATVEDPFRRPDYIFVDGTGLGGPIVDRLRTLLGETANVFEVQFGSSSPNPKLANFRMYMWWQMRESLRIGLAIPNDSILGLELCAPEIWHDKHDKLLMESKEDLKDRLPELGSPDRADALAISFAFPVQPKHSTNAARNGYAVKKDYDPYAM